MTREQEFGRRAFMRASAGAAAVGVTSLSGCAGVLSEGSGDGSPSGGGGSSDISGSIDVAESLQEQIEVVEHFDYVNKQRGNVGAGAELKNTGSEAVSVKLAIEFFKGGEKVREISGKASQSIDPGQTKVLKYGMSGSREDIDEYAITVNTVTG